MHTAKRDITCQMIQESRLARVYFEMLSDPEFFVPHNIFNLGIFFPLIYTYEVKRNKCISKSSGWHPSHRRRRRRRPKICAVDTLLVGICNIDKTGSVSLANCNCLRDKLSDANLCQDQNPTHLNILRCDHIRKIIPVYECKTP